MNRDKPYVMLLTTFFAALFGAILGSVGTIAVSQYEKASSQENLKVALTGEIEAIFESIRMPALRTAWAWDGKSGKMAHHQFYYPRSVFDGNIAHLGTLRDRKLVRKISQLYSGLELARDEGRRLDSGITDPDSEFRYATFMFNSYLKSLELIQELTGDFPWIYSVGSTDKDRLFNNEAITQDMKNITNASRAIVKQAISSNGTKSRKEDKTSLSPK